MSAWTKHVTQFYKAEHAKNPDYKFKNALKDAAKTYKSQGKSSAEEVPKKAKKGKSKKNKSKKNKSKKARKTRKH
jgi:hypothetical protein